MGTQALYRKHRSQNFDELIGQEHVKRALGNAIANSKINHAYLFSGPRGVGKTSTARILAKQINGGVDENLIDIIEIDAASNTSVEDIRELREKAHVSPSSGTHKIYIIDEVHMLSRAAFNAFLKILEEPPEHVIFILATTEPHKLPATIISRTQQFFFRPVPADILADHILQVAKLEKIKVEPEAARLIADAAEGSVRDALSLLDQLSVMTDSITASEAELLLGRASSSRLEQVLQAALSGQTEQLQSLLDELWRDGHDAVHLGKQLLARAHEMLRQQMKAGDPSAVATSRELVSELISALGHSAHQEIALEAALGVFAAHRGVPGATVAKVIEDTLEEPVPAEKAVEQKPVEPRVEPKPSKKPVVANFDEDVWHKILSATRDKSSSMYALLRAATPLGLHEDTLKLAFKFRFHERRMAEDKNRRLVEDVISSVMGRTILVETEHSASLPPLPAITPEPDSSVPIDASQDVEQVLRVLGGEVVNGN